MVIRIAAVCAAESSDSRQEQADRILTWLSQHGIESKLLPPGTGRQPDLVKHEVAYSVLYALRTIRALGKPATLRELMAALDIRSSRPEQYFTRFIEQGIIDVRVSRRGSGSQFRITERGRQLLKTDRIVFPQHPVVLADMEDTVFQSGQSPTKRLVHTLKQTFPGVLVVGSILQAAIPLNLRHVQTLISIWRTQQEQERGPTSKEVSQFTGKNYRYTIETLKEMEKKDLIIAARGQTGRNTYYLTSYGRNLTERLIVQLLA